MFGIRPTFDDELERVRVDTKLLENSFQNALEDVFVVGGPESKYQSLHVDVTSRQSLSNSNEWRILVPPFEPKLYVAVSELVHKTDQFMQLFVNLGTLLPLEFTVSVWLLNSNEPPIIGSIDK